MYYVYYIYIGYKSNNTLLQLLLSLYNLMSFKEVKRRNEEKHIETSILAYILIIFALLHFFL